MDRRETQIQKDLNTWIETYQHLDPRLEMFMATPNQRGNDIIWAVMRKKEGAKKGFPDTSLLCPGVWEGKQYPAMFLELKVKKTKSGAKPKPSPEQKKWILNLNKWGFFAAVCYADDYMEIVAVYKKYLGITW